MPDSIFVDNSRRRHGCLLFFLQQVEDQVNSQKDESEIEVLTKEDNKVAIGLYEMFGFSKVKELKNYYFQKVQSNIQMNIDDNKMCNAYLYKLT